MITIHNYRSVCASADLWRDGRSCHECVGRRFAFGGVRHGCYRDSRILSAVSASASRIQTGVVGELPTGRVVVPSEYLKATLVEGGFREDLFEVCPWTTPDPGARPSRPSESREVYFVGRLEPETKGIETLVGRWNRARSSGLLDGLRLNLVGSGPLQDSAEVSGPDVRSLGHLDRDELDRLLLSGRALVVPSLWEEPFGLVAIEAFAAGLPVIGTDRGALPETVGLLGEECLLPGDDDAAWERGLSWLSDDRFVDTRGAQARQVWHERFMTSSGIDRLEGVLAAASGASFGSGS